jgi:hypothetical protein
MKRSAFPPLSDSKWSCLRAVVSVWHSLDPAGAFLSDALPTPDAAGQYASLYTSILTGPRVAPGPVVAQLALKSAALKRSGTKGR